MHTDGSLAFASSVVWRVGFEHHFSRHELLTLAGRNVSWRLTHHPNPSDTGRRPARVAVRAWVFQIKPVRGSSAPPMAGGESEFAGPTVK
jgi:hypothetical protein